MQPTEKTAFQDEQDRRAELAEQRRVAEAERLRDAYNQLKFTAVRSRSAMNTEAVLWALPCNSIRYNACNVCQA